MKTVVITGSSKGIGYGLADAFLARGCNVVINSRSEKAVIAAVQTLEDKHMIDRIYGCFCDVADYAAVMHLWETAVQHFGQVDIWINNAGQSHPQKSFWEQRPEQVRSVADTNFLGAMNGSHVALTGMIKRGSGSLYNMLGLGSNGMQVKGFGLYGSTKRGIAYLTKALAKDVAGTNVQVGSISPGMVATDLLLHAGDAPITPRMKKIFSILADHVETIAPWIADRILHNNINGTAIAWLTKPKILWRFLSSPFVRRNVIEM
ncbi:SDR family NAD(P)-dependent oxidoreductase [Chitinophagaceae bacterium MMS25-I14]